MKFTVVVLNECINTVYPIKTGFNNPVDKSIQPSWHLMATWLPFLISIFQQQSRPLTRKYRLLTTQSPWANCIITGASACTDWGSSGKLSRCLSTSPNLTFSQFSHIRFAPGSFDFDIGWVEAGGLPQDFDVAIKTGQPSAKAHYRRGLVLQALGKIKVEIQEK